MLSNNKFLGKCWYGGHPWIRLAMESERMLEKGINFIFCLGTAYGISSMESVGNSKSFSLVGWIHLLRESWTKGSSGVWPVSHGPD